MPQFILQIIVKSSLAVLFVYSAIVKLFHHDTFFLELSRSPLIPNEMVHLISFLIPTVEILLAIGLLIQRTNLIGLYGSFFLMLCFTFYLVILTNFFANIPCACGGILGGMSYPVHIAFNIFFTFVALVGIYTSEEQQPMTEPQTL